MDQTVAHRSVFITRSGVHDRHYTIPYRIPIETIEIDTPGRIQISPETEDWLAVHDPDILAEVAHHNAYTRAEHERALDRIARDIGASADED